MGGEIVRLLSDHTALGLAYRVDMRLRPEGDQGALARSLAATLGYYETARPDLGAPGADQVPADRRRPRPGPDLPRGDHPVRLPPLPQRGRDRRDQGDEAADRAADGLGRDAPRSRSRPATAASATSSSSSSSSSSSTAASTPRSATPTRSTAIARLEQVGCLTAEERGIMEDTYRFLRRVEHRLQIMFDRQTHEMPRDLEEQRTLAIRMGYPPASAWEDRTGPAQRFLADYRSQDRAEPADPQPPAPRRLPRRRRRRGRPGRRPGARPRPRPRADRRGARPLPVPRPADGLPEPDGAGPRGHPVPLAGPLPPLPRRDRPPAAPGGRPDRPTPTWR